MAKIYFPSKSSIHKGELLVFNLIIWVRGRTQSWHNLGPKRDGGGPLQTPQQKERAVLSSIKFFGSFL